MLQASSATRWTISSKEPGWASAAWRASSIRDVYFHAASTSVMVHDAPRFWRSAASGARVNAAIGQNRYATLVGLQRRLSALVLIFSRPQLKLAPPDLPPSCRFPAPP